MYYDIFSASYYATDSHSTIHFYYATHLCFATHSYIAIMSEFRCRHRTLLSSITKFIIIYTLKIFISRKLTDVVEIFIYYIYIYIIYIYIIYKI